MLVCGAVVQESQQGRHERSATHLRAQRTPTTVGLFDIKVRDTDTDTDGWVVAKQWSRSAVHKEYVDLANRRWGDTPGFMFETEVAQAWLPGAIVLRLLAFAVSWQLVP